MKLSFKISVPLIFLFLIFCSCSKDDDNVADNSSEQEILALVNDYRRSKSLPEFESSAIAEGLALDHASFMANNEALSIENNEERKQILREEENATVVVEFNARFYDSNTLVDIWLEDTVNRNILEGSYDKVGVASAEDKNGKPYYTFIIYRVSSN